jgi:hypothetical protein
MKRKVSLAVIIGLLVACVATAEDYSGWTVIGKAGPGDTLFVTVTTTDTILVIRGLVAMSNNNVIKVVAPWATTYIRWEQIVTMEISKLIGDQDRN